mmetsp:Transcript_36283/g.78530  ORF Transcript_36283/g.78530 Transcript_36283/m.78530 type:complete len:141 (-) Transcript_36283:363-785(-)
MQSSTTTPSSNDFFHIPATLESSTSTNELFHNAATLQSSATTDTPPNSGLLPHLLCSRQRVWYATPCHKPDAFAASCTTRACRHISGTSTTAPTSPAPSTEHTSYGSSPAGRGQGTASSAAEDRQSPSASAAKRSPSDAR